VDNYSQGLRHCTHFQGILFSRRSHGDCARSLRGEQWFIYFGCGSEENALGVGGVRKRKSNGTVISSFTDTYDDAGKGQRVSEGNGDGTA